MKMLALTVTCLLAVSGALAGAGDSCYQDVSLECAATSNSLKLPRCNARYGNYGEHGAVATELQAYAGLQLRRSYEYLLSSAFFNNYQTNRKGFSQLFRKLSDEAWGKTIGLIKHITMRGDQMDFSRRSRHDSPAKNHTVELSELEALSRALDSQKELAERAFHIHREATRNSQDLHDPEITQYLEEEFIEYQSKTIRSLAGHAADLKQFITTNGGQDVSLAYYLFDEYLQKSA